MSADQTASLSVNSISKALGCADDGFLTGKPNSETVKPNANGRWKEILSALGVDPATLNINTAPARAAVLRTDFVSTTSTATVPSYAAKAA